MGTLLVPDDDFKRLFADEPEPTDEEVVGAGAALDNDTAVRVYFLTVHGTSGTWN